MLETHVLNILYMYQIFFSCETHFLKKAVAYNACIRCSRLKGNCTVGGREKPVNPCVIVFVYTDIFPPVFSRYRDICGGDFTPDYGILTLGGRS
jgi:hypothetical protein